MLMPEDILTVMGTHAKSVCSKVYPQDRPNATTDKLTSFIVASMPYAPANRMLGENDDWWIDQTVAFDVYVADRKRASDPKDADLATMKNLRSSLIALFPIIDPELGIKITRPRTVINASSDGNGYHFSRIQAKMTTMV